MPPGSCSQTRDALPPRCYWAAEWLLTARYANCAPRFCRAAVLVTCCWLTVNCLLRCCACCRRAA
eukprot:2200760-Lingulodinium_polyedra.AAC.1